MTGYDASAWRFNVVNNVIHHIVIARVSLFDWVPHWWLVVVLLGEGSFFAHVSASDQLHTEVVAQNLGGGDLVSDDLLHSFEVALESVHDDGFITNIELVSELLTERLDGCLHESLLSVDVEHAVFVACVVGDVDSLLRKVLKYLQVSIWNSNTTTNGDLRQNALMLASLSFIKLKEVRIGVDFKGRNFVGLVVWEFKRLK